jgi:hypothetical protein
MNSIPTIRVSSTDVRRRDAIAMRGGVFVLVEGVELRDGNVYAQLQGIAQPRKLPVSVRIAERY